MTSRLRSSSQLLWQRMGKSLGRPQKKTKEDIWRSGRMITFRCCSSLCSSRFSSHLWAVARVARVCPCCRIWRGPMERGRWGRWCPNWMEGLISHLSHMPIDLEAQIIINSLLLHLSTLWLLRWDLEIWPISQICLRCSSHIGVQLTKTIKGHSMICHKVDCLKSAKVVNLTKTNMVSTMAKHNPKASILSANQLKCPSKKSLLSIRSPKETPILNPIKWRANELSWKKLAAISERFYASRLD